MRSLSIAGLHTASAKGPWALGVRACLEWVGSTGFRSVQLDASAPEIRPRTLDRSGRRDLAATLRRNELGLTGIDLWIPPQEFEDPARTDRATAAVIGAIELTADLAALVPHASPALVAVTLPEQFEGAHEIAGRAESLGVAIEDYGAGERITPQKGHGAPDPRTGQHSGLGRGAEGTVPTERPIQDRSVIRPGIDTGRLILRGSPPGKTFASAASDLVSLRLNDADDTGRRPMGKGNLKIATLIALHATLASTVPIVTDLRGLTDPQHAARAAYDALSSSPF